MRWFKHMTASANDEKLAKLKDQFGLEGYGFWWSVVEIIAGNVDESGQTFVEFSAKKWGNSLGISPKKFRIMAEFCAKIEIFEVKISDKYILINMPNILKYRDEYTERKIKKSVKNRDSVGTNSGPRACVLTETDTDTDTETEILNTPLTPPLAEGNVGGENSVSPQSDFSNSKNPPPSSLKDGTNPRSQGTNSRATGKNPRNRGKPESDESLELDDVPGIEFEQLRQLFNREMRSEGPLAGWPEYKSLKKTGNWPGLCRIEHDIAQRKDARIWNQGYEISLARYLRERTWLAPVKPRASPQQTDNLSIAEQNKLTGQRVLARREKRRQEAENAAIAE